jgi:hypothetical protein
MPSNKDMNERHSQLVKTSCSEFQEVGLGFR